MPEGGGNGPGPGPTRPLDRRHGGPGTPHGETPSADEAEDPGLGGSARVVVRLLRLDHHPFFAMSKAKYAGLTRRSS